MTEHQPGTVLPLSECKPGWLVDLGENISDILAEDRIFRVHNAPTISAKVTLISTLPGWTPVGEGDPGACKRVQACWPTGHVSTLYWADLHLGIGPLGGKPIFWRDASADAAPAQAPDLPPNVRWDEKAQIAWATQNGHSFGSYSVENWGSKERAIAAASRHGETDADPDLAAQVAELRARLEQQGKLLGQVVAAFETHKHPLAGDDIEMTGLPRHGPVIPEPGEAVMGDDFLDEVLSEIEPLIRPGHHHSWQMRADKDFVRTVAKVIDLTRASIRAQLAANEEGAVEMGYRKWAGGALGVGEVVTAALKAHKEGV